MQPTAVDLGIVICVERGVLEAQAILLCESLRTFGGRFAGTSVYALSPRAGMRPTPATITRLESLGVEYIDEALNTECADYGSANRVAAAAYIERRARHQVLAILDTDTLFVAEPDAFALDAQVVAAVRPVDVKGMCSSGPSDPNDVYWRRLCACCDVAYDSIPFLSTTIDQERVKASYNAGLVVVRADRGILARWWEYFLTSVRLGLRPWPTAPSIRSSIGEVPPASGRWWGSNQAALSLALWSTTRAVGLLPAGYNYPLHLHAQAPERTRASALARLVHVHYHFMFDADALPANALLGTDSPLGAAQAEWLRSRVPLVEPAASSATVAGDADARGGRADVGHRSRASGLEP